MKRFINILKAFIIVVILTTPLSCSLVKRVEIVPWNNNVSYLMPENEEMIIVLMPKKTVNVGFCTFGPGTWFMKVSHLNLDQSDKTIEAFWYFIGDRESLAGSTYIGTMEYIIPVITEDDKCLRNILTNSNDVSLEVRVTIKKIY